jgi:hypothetical protein
MADTLQWFRLWISSLTDPDLDNLSIADFGRWAKLGAYIKQQGTAGTVLIHPPARALCGMLQVPDIDTLIDAIKRFPNVEIEEGKNSALRVTDASVTFSVCFRNWQKYQVDTTWVRMRRMRSKHAKPVTPKRRREEKRGEEKRGDNPPTPRGGAVDGFSRFWKAYPKKVGKGAAEAAWKKLRPGNGAVDAILSALSWQRKSEQWTKERGQFVPNPATYLNQRRWEDEPPRPAWSLADALGENDAAD